MKKPFDITVENKLLKDKRDIHLYFHAVKSTHILSHGSSVAAALEVVSEGDYIHISIPTGPGLLEHRVTVDIPSWADIEFTNRDSASRNGFTFTHCAGRSLLRIPPGPPLWELKITCPDDLPDSITSDYIRIGDG
ncbi:MAG: hypothetical protein GY765_00390 [bacterium]|nr:hypothetical protein [bacterium]